MSLFRAQAYISRPLDDVFTEFLTLVAGKTAQEVKVWGPKDDAANISPPSLWWSPGDEKWSAPQRHGTAGAPGALFVREIPISILVFGGENLAEDYATEREEEFDGAPEPSSSLHDTDVTEALLESLINAFHRRCSQNGYQVASVSWGADAQTGIAIACELTVLLRLPLVRIDNPVVTLEGIVPTVTLPSDVP